MSFLSKLVLTTGIASAAAFAALKARRSLVPLQGGEFILAGLDGEIEIVRDTSGIPHVRAESFAGIFFGQGFVHAQDRLWQMDLGRRAASGRLSEVFGTRTIELDRFYRHVGLRRAAEREWSGIEGEGRLMLESFSRGVNAAIAKLPPPPEARLLRYGIEPWSPVDSLAFAKLLGWGLAPNWESELSRLHILEMSGRPDPYPESFKSAKEGQPEDSAGAGQIQIPSGGGGSNAWAVTGEHTKSGKPLLAGDPHLRSGLPANWMLLHLTGGGLDVAGAAVPAVPGLLVGHNRHVAWSVTASLSDSQDLFIEKFSSERPDEYFHDGEWKKASVHTEVINVRKSAPVTERVVETVHGPVITPILDEPRPMALQSTILAPHPESGAALLAMMRATSVEEFRTALHSWSYPPLNYVFADVHGGIGLQVAGAIPKRKQGAGELPVPGDGEWDWNGDIPGNLLPSLINPPSGKVYSANNAPPTAGGLDPEPPYLGYEWSDAFRAQRIRQRLDLESAHDVSSFRSMQGDVVSIPLQRLAREIAAVKVEREIDERCRQALLDWDGRLSVDSLAGAVIEIVRLRLLEESFAGAGSDEMLARLGGTRNAIARINSSAYRNSSHLIASLETWIADGSWPGRGRKALEQATDELTRTLGDPVHWRWGGLHLLTLHHPLGAFPPLAPFLNRGPYPVGGDTDTIHQTAVEPQSGLAAAAWIPSLRQIYDLGDWDNSRAVLPGGQSGNPLSPEYADQVVEWLAIQDRPFVFSKAAVDRATRSRLTLRPR